MAIELSVDDVRTVARLARLKLDDTDLERYRLELATIIEHVSRLQAIDVRDVEPMAYPAALTNRFDDDVVAPSLSPQALLSIAPAVEDGLLAVPKVLHV